MNKLIVIGIDGACWDYIDPLIKDGRVPNIRHMIEHGCRGALKSTIPPLTPPAWSSFITGKHPRKHGIFDFSIYENNAVRVVNAANRKGLPFWNYLNGSGIKVGVCGIPFTYPQDPIDGFLICGFDTPEDAQTKTYPPELSRRLEEKYGKYFFHEPPLNMLYERRDEFFVELCKEQSKLQTEAAIALMDEYQVEVMLINYMLFDHFNHYMKEYSHVEDAVEIIDQNIGKFLNKFPDANFIILSDHGSCRLKSLFLIEDWLEEKGWLTFNQGQVQRVRLNRAIASIFEERWRWKGVWEKIIRNGIVRFLSFIPSGLQSLVIDMCTKIHGSAITYWKGDAIDLKKSTVLSTNYGLYINLPNGKGALNPGESEQEYNTIRETLIKELLSINDPLSNLPFFLRVYRKEEVFAGEFLASAPDLIILPNANCGTIHGAVIQKEAFVAPFFVKNDAINHYGGHIDEGMFVFYGNAFNKHGHHSLHIVDIPAFILYLCGVPIPDDFDGVVVKEFFHQDFIKANPVTHQIALSDSYGQETVSREDSFYEDEQEDKVKQRLKDLGYM